MDHWICPTPTCAERQFAHAIQRPQLLDGLSPFLYVPLPLQVELEESPTKRLLMAGAAGASKSYGGRWHLYSQCRKVPGYRALLLRCSYDELYKNHLQYMGTEAEQLGDAEWKGGATRQMVFENDAIIFMGYCDDLADIPRHLGPEWDEIVFEEGVNFLPKALAEISARDRGSHAAALFWSRNERAEFYCKLAESRSLVRTSHQ